MTKTLLVSLVSDQTIPNVQLIKEFRDEVTDYLFISTDSMQKSGIQRWIETACSIRSTEPILVDEYSFQDIDNRLKGYNFEVFDKVIVNLTGGTKIMTLAAYDFFGKIKADIYYVKGNNNKYVTISNSDNSQTANARITLGDYLTAYGFSYGEADSSNIPVEQTKIVYKNFVGLNLDEHLDAMKYLNGRREKKVLPEEYSRIENYIKALGYEPKKQGELDKTETKYLTGDWFEEYMGHTIKEALQLSDDDLFVGREITKEIPKKQPKNSIPILLGDEDGVDSKNEMDVMFMYQNRFYSIECKTSIVAFKMVADKNGQVQEKAYNILGETIYKSDFLKSKFGLFANTFIVALTNFKAYADGDNNKMRSMKSLIGRANLSGITLVDKSRLENEDICSILGINAPC